MNKINGRFKFRIISTTLWETNDGYIILTSFSRLYSSVYMVGVSGYFVEGGATLWW